MSLYPFTEFCYLIVLTLVTTVSVCCQIVLPLSPTECSPQLACFWGKLTPIFSLRVVWQDNLTLVNFSLASSRSPPVGRGVYPMAETAYHLLLLEGGRVLTDNHTPIIPDQATFVTLKSKTQTRLSTVNSYIIKKSYRCKHWYCRNT